MRQRASKAGFLSTLINKVNMDKSEQEKVNKLVDGYMQPWKIEKLEKDVEGDWEALRRMPG